jgi:hypothetical protein
MNGDPAERTSVSLTMVRHAAHRLRMETEGKLDLRQTMGNDFIILLNFVPMLCTTNYLGSDQSTWSVTSPAEGCPYEIFNRNRSGGYRC